MRSSGRIPKEIPILLFGSDLNGKVFSEPTTTVLLSLHGAGILSRRKLSPEQELILPASTSRNSRFSLDFDTPNAFAVSSAVADFECRTTGKS